MSVSMKLLILLIPILFIEDSFCQRDKIIHRLFSDDPDIYYDVPGFLASRGFGSESFDVTTEDGYILRIFRIINPYIEPHQLKPKPVLMWHGFLDSAEVFLRNRKGRLNSNGVYSEDNDTVVNDCNNNITSTLGYTLSACGYDVWLANTRGNQYSNRHVNPNITTLDPKYWEFSLTEVGLYDVPATVQLVLQITKKESLSLIGYSMGTTISFILLSLRPDFEQYYRPFIALAPVAFLSLTTSIVHLIAPIEPFVRLVAIGFGLPLPLAEFLGAFICGNGVLVYLCVAAQELVFGKDTYNLDLSRVPANVASSMDITSSRILLHFAQLINSGRFAKFDFGPILNLEHYNQKESPSFPLSAVTSKYIYLFQGSNDPLADPLDIQRLARRIPVKKLRTNPWPRWAHLDPSQARYENRFEGVSILKVLGSYN